MTRSAWAAMALVFAVAVVSRVGWVVVRHGGDPASLQYPDEHAYLLAARSLAAGEGLVDEFGYRATYMPAYPAFVAAFVATGMPMLALRIVQAMLAALVAPATYLLARHWVMCVLPNGDTKALVDLSRGTTRGPGRSDDAHREHAAAMRRCRMDTGAGRRVALAAGALAAFDPFLVFFSGLLLTEALFAVALVATWWVVLRVCTADRGGAIANGVCAGLPLVAAIMLRPSATILLAAAPAVVVLWRRYDRWAWMASAILVFATFAGLFPWAARNASVLGEWRWTTTRGGISLYDAMQPGATGASDLAHTKLDPVVAKLDESAWDRHWREQAWKFVRDDPARVVRLAGLKFLRTWNVVPNEPNARRGATALISAVWMAMVLVSAGVGLWCSRRHVTAWLALLTPAIAFTLLHMVFVGSVRYRIPVMPMLFVLSAVGIAACWPKRQVAPPHESARAGGDTA